MFCKRFRDLLKLKIESNFRELGILLVEGKIKTLTECFELRSFFPESKNLVFLFKGFCVSAYLTDWDDYITCESLEGITFDSFVRENQLEEGVDFDDIDLEDLEEISVRLGREVKNLKFINKVEE